MSASPGFAPHPHKQKMVTLLIAKLSSARRHSIKGVSGALFRHARFETYMLHLPDCIKSQMKRRFGDPTSFARHTRAACKQALGRILRLTPRRHQLITLYGVVQSQPELAEKLRQAIGTPKNEFTLLLHYLIGLAAESSGACPSPLYSSIMALKDRADMPYATPLCVFLIMASCCSESTEVLNSLSEAQDVEVALAEMLHRPTYFAMMFNFYHLVTNALPTCYDYIMDHGVGLSEANRALVASTDDWKTPHKYFFAPLPHDVAEAERRFLSRYPDLYEEMYGQKPQAKI